MNTIKRENLVSLFRCIALRMDEMSDTLTEMDARMGDGDLGLTMKKGFDSLPQIVEELDEPDLGKALMKAGMKMATVVPSTMGTLMSSGFMSGGKAISGIAEMDAPSYLAFLRGFEAGIEKRGKCQRGDRTILDAIGAAADEAERALQSDNASSLDSVAEAAVRGAANGVEATKQMVPKFGKAAVHKDAAVGIADQGACAGLYLMEGIYHFISG